MKNKAFRILLLVVLAVFAAASLTACSAAKDLVNEMTGKNDIVSVSYIKSVNGIEAQYKAGAVIDYDNASVTVVYTNGEEKTVKLSQTSFDKIDTSTLGDKELKVVYKGAIFRMTVKFTSTLPLPSFPRLWGLRLTETNSPGTQSKTLLPTRFTSTTANTKATPTASFSRRRAAEP